jgi:hypothetical protein
MLNYYALLAHRPGYDYQYMKLLGRRRASVAFIIGLGTSDDTGLPPTGVGGWRSNITRYQSRLTLTALAGGSAHGCGTRAQSGCGPQSSLPGCTPHADNCKTHLERRGASVSWPRHTSRRTEFTKPGQRNRKMASPARLELATLGLGNQCSIRLSYGDFSAPDL